jgi:hypothetical protein
VARAGSLLAVAALPAVVGLSGSDYAVPEAFSSAYRTAMLICAALLSAGGVVSWLLISNPAPTAEPAGDREGADVAQPATRHTRSVPAGWSCAGSEGCPGTSHDGIGSTVSDVQTGR